MHTGASLGRHVFAAGRTRSLSAHRLRGKTSPLPLASTIALAILAVLIGASQMSLADTTWTVGTGGWSDANNWTNGEPASGSDAYVNNGGTVQISQSGEACRYLYLGSQSATTGYVSMTSGSLSAALRAGYGGRGEVALSGGTISGGFSLGYQGFGAMAMTGGRLESLYPQIAGYSLASFNHSAGTHVVASGWMEIGYMPGSYGSYTLNNSGVLDASGKVVYLGVNGTGTFWQGGITVASMGTLRMGAAGLTSSTYNLTAGNLNTTCVEMHPWTGGNAALFAHSGGTHQIAGDLSMGSFEDVIRLTGRRLGDSSYELTGGTLSVGGAVTGARGPSTLVLDGGVLDMTSGGAITVRNLDVARSTSTSYTQTGSESVTVTGNMGLAGGSGVDGGYTMSSSGSLKAARLNIGVDGNGTMDQTSGVVQAGRVRLGRHSTGLGNYQIDGDSSLLDTGHLEVGEAGSGQLTQDGGTVQLHMMMLGELFNSSGVYELNGGLLRNDPMSQSAEIIGLRGAGQFNHNGGRHMVSFLQIGIVGAGQYNLDCASGDHDLAADVILIGNYAAGAFNHTAGSVKVGSLSLGGVASSYTLTAGGLDANVITVNGSGNTFTQNGGNVVMSPAAGLGTVNVVASAMYAVGGGSLTAQVMNVGYGNDDAIVDQSAGVVTTDKLYVGTKPVTGGFYTAQNAGVPMYRITGGELHVIGNLCCYVGYDGQAFFDHTGNDECLVEIDHKLYVGKNAGSHGTYHLGGGSLVVGDDLRVGADSGFGRFYWQAGRSSGGTIDTPALTLGSKGDLAMGYSFNMADLAGGSTNLFGRSTSVTGLGQATLEVTNGATATHPGGSSYTRGGLRVGSAYGGGTYSQQGGTLNAKYIEINDSGLYQFGGGGGGAIGVTGGGLHVGGTMDFNGYAVNVHVQSNSLVNFTDASNIQQAGNTSLTIDANTLSIFPSGFDPSTTFASYSSSGDVHTAGTMLNIGSGRKYVFAGTISDEVQFSGGGGLTATTDKYVNLEDFRQLGGGGTVDLGQGVLTVHRSNGTIFNSGSRLSARNAFITAGTSDSAALIQSAGSVTFSEALTLGEGDGQKGTYSIGGGTLTVGSLFVGNSDVGGDSTARSIFNHDSGNVNVAQDLYLGFKGRSYGEYICYAVTSNLVGGFAVKCATIGYEGTGVFTHKHGTVTINGEMMLGKMPGSSGTYTIESGVSPGEGSKLEVDSLVIGGAGAGTFSIQDANMPIVVRKSLRFGADSTFSCVPGGTIRVTGPDIGWDLLSTSPGQLAGRGNLTVVVTGGTGATGTFEAAGQDLGIDPNGWTGNFALGTLVLGSPAGSVSATLADKVSNTLTGQGEAFYVGVLQIGAGSELDANGLALYCSNSSQQGHVYLNEGTIGSSGTFANAGTISGNGTLMGEIANQGLISPGESVGTIAVQGDYTQSADGTLRMELTAAGEGDLVTVSGAASLDGTLDVQTGSYRPRQGDQFAIMQTEGGVTGSFATITTNLTLGSAGFSGAVDANDYKVEFTGYTTGDATGNGAVNSGDLSMLTGSWGETSGNTWADGDFNGDGAVNSGDLSLLTGDWGWTLPTPAPGAVPEPATVALLGLGGLALVRRKR